MPFIIRRENFVDITVMVGHSYNDTEDHQVRVLSLQGPTKHDPKGVIEIDQQGDGFRAGWKHPSVIGAEWVGVQP